LWYGSWLDARRYGIVMLTVEDAELKDAAQYFVSVSIGTQNFSSATTEVTATPKWGAGARIVANLRLVSCTAEASVALSSRSRQRTAPIGTSAACATRATLKAGVCVCSGHVMGKS
jgi:hypothetical protein